MLTARTFCSFIKIHVSLTAFIPFFSAAYTADYAQKTKELYLQSFGIPQATVNVLVSSPSFDTPSDFMRYLWQQPARYPTMNDNDTRYAALSASKSPLYPDSTIDLHLCQKMGLVAGTEAASATSHLASYLSSTNTTQNQRTSILHTTSGMFSLISTLSQPHTNITELKKKQHIIKTCANDNRLYSRLTKLLKKAGSEEKHVLAYYSDRDPALMYMKSIEKYYLWQLPIINALNASLLGLEGSARFFYAQKLLATTLGTFFFAWMSQSFWDEKVVPGFKTHISDPLQNYIPAFAQHGLTWAASLKDKSWYRAGSWSWRLGSASLNFASELAICKFNQNILNCVQEHLIGIHNYIDMAKKLYTHLHNNPEISSHYYRFMCELETLVSPTSKHSEEFYELLTLLDTDTFQEEPSFWSRVGRVLRAHLIMSKPAIQAELTRIINAVGELDTYIALASKIKTTAGKDVRYSFAEFDITSQCPYIKATGLWNPFIDENKTVTNTIELGGSQPRNIILSGPNTGGKSTLSKGVLLNIILAQTYGITAAQTLQFTPFDNLDCFMNITDNTAAGVSGLLAEVNRGKEIIQKVKGCKKFSFLLLDEIFIATSPEQAEQLAIKFISALSSNPHCLFIDAAHFDGIVRFAEQSPHCKNYYMGAITDTNGAILKYTHKLIEGVSHIKNATQVAQEIFTFA